MSRRTNAAILSALLLVGVPGAVIAQEPQDEPMWPAATKKGAASAAALSDGFLAVGSNRKPLVSKVWESADGSSWSRQESGDQLEGASMSRVEAFGDGAVALGQDGRRLVAFHSPDGSDWARFSVDRADKDMELFPQSLASGPNGLVAVANMVGQDIAGQRFYQSADGEAWTRIATPPETNGLFVSLKSTPDEYLAIARPGFTPGSDLYWRSTDGVTWETFEGPEDGNIHDIAYGDGTFVAVGARPEPEEGQRQVVWAASELGDWEVVYSYPSAKETEDRLHRVEAAAPGFVAAGTISGCPVQPRTCIEASILVSEDGREWRLLGIPDGVPGPLDATEVISIASDGETTVLVAFHEEGRSELWTLTPTDA